MALTMLEVASINKKAFSKLVSKAIKEETKGTMLGRLKVASTSYKQALHNKIGLCFNVQHYIKKNNDKLLLNMFSNNLPNIYDYITIKRYDANNGRYKQEVFILNEPVSPKKKENGLPLLVMVCSPFAYSVIRIYLPPNASLLEEAVNASAKLIIDLIRKGDS